MSERGERPAPATGTGPSEIAPARKPLSHQSNAQLADVLPMRPRWSQALIDGADGPIPPYRSAAWLALPDDSRAKVAATVLAAEEGWARRNRPDYIAPMSSRRAREIAEARRPRPDDHPGGPVEYERTEAR